jgi:serine-type D-Ala-D-Ala carboxypeptidase/endopeptidase (penicillin-binding protein 4)
MKPVLYITLAIALANCTITKKVTKQANAGLLKDSAVSTGHIGICVYEPATGKYLYNHNATHYFIPASNTKLFTLYAGMKYLGDSLAGLRYHTTQLPTGMVTSITPTGDPGFLLTEFTAQPVLNFLQQQKQIVINQTKHINPMGMGWAWDDYQETYMTPRSAFPMYGNMATVKWIHKDSAVLEPKYFNTITQKKYPLVTGVDISKGFNDNLFVVSNGSAKRQEINFIADGLTTTALLKDILPSAVISLSDSVIVKSNHQQKIIYSQPSDSLFKPMMHRSDNFFAEQTLLMVGNELLGYMDTEAVIDTILRSSLNTLPQRPKWVDGSGLSRYNLFTPQSIVHLLNKMKEEFGMPRLQTILPTGGEGTLSAYYKNDAGYIYAKTGTLSNNCALSGYLITKKGKLLIFSVLANNYITGATPVRRAIERFLLYLRHTY